MTTLALHPKSQLPALAGFIALTLAVGAISGVATAAGVSGWYQTLVKPAFNPPNWLFGPVWTALYVLMAVAAWRVWRIAGWTTQAMQLFLAQLALNFAWSFIFFGAHATGVALIEIVVLWIAIVATTVAFWRIDRPAGWMMVPYIAWVSFATILNASIWLLN